MTAPDEIERLNLDGFAGVLCFGEMIRRLYLERDLAARGLGTVRARQTCARRAEELPAICTGCGVPPLTREAAGAA